MTYSQKDLNALELELKKNPDKSACYVKLADCQLALNKNQQAFSTYRAAKLICPDDPVIMRMGAKVFEALGKREEAVDCLKKALETGDEKVFDTDTVSHLAELLYNSGKKDSALDWLKKLIKISDEKPEVLIKLAQIHLSLGNILESQKYLKEYKSKAGATREMYTLMGETMLARGFYDGAVKNYTDAVESFNKDADMHLGLGKAWLGMGETDIALKELNKALELRPNDINILLELGKLQYSKGLFDLSDETFTKIENSKLPNGECFLDIAEHFHKNKNDLKALKYLEKARVLSPFHLGILKLLGDICLKMKRYEQAEEVFTSATTADSTALWAYEGLSKAAEATKHFSIKADAQKHILSLKDSSADEWCDYGETLIRLGNFEEAQDVFEKASKIDPTCLRAYQAPEIIKLEKARAEGEKLANLGEEALEKRFYMTATERVEKALSLVPDNPDWSKLLAKISLNTANIEKASHMLSVVRAAEPENFEAGFQLARTYEFMNNLEMSVELLTALIKDYPFELRAHLMLLKLKRCLAKGTRTSTDMLDSIIKNIDSDLSSFRRESPVPMLVKGYAFYIFSYRSNYQVEALRKAEICFTDVLKTFGETQEAFYALALVERMKGNFDKAVDYLKMYINLVPKTEKYAELAKMYENFCKYDEAKKIYSTLREQEPENGYYRRKYVESISNIHSRSGKNELLSFLSETHKNLQTNSGSVWPIYETAIGQELAYKNGESGNEWQKRSLLSWRKAENHPKFNHWVLWEMTRSILDNAQETEKNKLASSLKKLIEKNIREMPDSYGSYLAMGRCLLAYNDLTINEKALDYLKKAWFLNQLSVETGMLLAETAKSLGKSDIVDVVGYNVVLSEPEITNSIFKIQ